MSSRRFRFSDEAGQHRHPEPLPRRDDLRPGVRGPERNFRRGNLSLARPVRDALVVPDNPPNAIGRSRAPRGKEVAGHVDTAEQLRSLQAVKIGRHGVAVVDDADRNVDLSVGQSVTRRSQRTLWSRPKTRISSWFDDASICSANSRTSSPASVRR
jgi:hypothetical protein